MIYKYEIGATLVFTVEADTRDAADEKAKRFAADFESEQILPLTDMTLELEESLPELTDEHMGNMANLNSVVGLSPEELGLVLTALDAAAHISTQHGHGGQARDLRRLRDKINRRSR